jgi:hypothetical protein
VQLALSLDDPALLAQPVNRIRWEHLLEHGPYVVAGHGLAPSESPIIGCLSWTLLVGSRTLDDLAVKWRRIAIPVEVWLK